MSMRLARVRRLVGLLLLGQGLLVATGVLSHETPWALAIALVGAGLALAAWPTRAPAAESRRAVVPVGRATLVALLGAGCIAGPLIYNAWTGAMLNLPKLAIVAYGVALAAASRRLGARVAGRPVGTLVAYSFPLVLAPLALWALEALLARGEAPGLSWYVRDGLVLPMAALLRLGGLDATSSGTTVALAGAEGPLFLTVGVACAGLYAGIVFLGIFGLFAWEEGARPRRLALELGAGLVGLHAVNVLRLALLGVVGVRWGGEALQRVHQDAGWLLFLAWTVAFWAVVFRSRRKSEAAALRKA